MTLIYYTPPVLCGPLFYQLLTEIVAKRVRHELNYIGRHLVEDKLRNFRILSSKLFLKIATTVVWDWRVAVVLPGLVHGHLFDLSSVVFNVARVGVFGRRSLICIFLVGQKAFLEYVTFLSSVLEEEEEGLIYFLFGSEVLQSSFCCCLFWPPACLVSILLQRVRKKCEHISHIPCEIGGSAPRKPGRFWKGEKNLDYKAYSWRVQPCSFLLCGQVTQTFLKVGIRWICNNVPEPTSAATFCHCLSKFFSPTKIRKCRKELGQVNSNNKYWTNQFGPNCMVTKPEIGECCVVFPFHSFQALTC